MRVNRIGGYYRCNHSVASIMSKALDISMDAYGGWSMMIVF
jgi:hypothetical protein